MILIGKTIRITASTNQDNIGLEGMVTQDGRETLTIETPRGQKVFVKHTITFTLDGRTVEGKTLMGDIAARHKK